MAATAMDKGGTKMGKDMWKSRGLILLILGSALVCLFYYHSYIALSYDHFRTLWTSTDAVIELTDEHYGFYHNETISRSQIRSGFNNAFFIESSCSAASPIPIPGVLRLNKRQACAVYSFATLNPDHNVYIFHTCPLHENFYEISSDAVRKVLKLKNVAVVEGGYGQNLARWLDHGPLSGIIQKISDSAYPIEHLADALRLLLVWRFGGTYLDLDTLTIKKNWDKFGRNWAGAESPSTIANGLLNADVEGIGHYIFGLALQQFNERYNGQGWSDNGPALLTRIVREVCNLTEQANLENVNRIESCGFKVFSPQAFYPIPYQEWRWYFQEVAEGAESWRAEIEKAMAVHVWNKLSKDQSVIVGSRTPYGLLAAEYCGPVYYSSPTF